MRGLLFFVSFIFSVSLYSQGASSNGAGREISKKYLVDKAYEVVRNFSPNEYNRIQGAPEITDTLVFESNTERYLPFVGRTYYRLTFPYEFEKDTCKKEDYHKFARYFAYVDIWADDGEPKGIMLGGGRGYNFMSTSYNDWVARGVKPEEYLTFECWEIVEVICVDK